MSAFFEFLGVIKNSSGRPSSAEALLRSSHVSCIRVVCGHIARMCGMDGISSSNAH